MKIDRFGGMTNVLRDNPKFPRIIANMYNKGDGSINKREGYSLFLDIKNADCLFSVGDELLLTGIYDDNDWLLCVDRNRNIFPIVKVPAGIKLYYVLIDDKVYINSMRFKGIYDTKVKTFSNWEKPVDEFPEDINSSSAFALEDLIEPPFMHSMITLGGRIVGLNGNYILYSNHFAYNMFASTNFIKFEEEPQMLVPDRFGCYVCFKNKTLYANGLDIATAKFSLAGNYGGIRGTYSYKRIPRLDLSAPIWLDKDCIVTAIEGKVFSLTGGRFELPMIKEAAVLFRKINGEDQYIVSVPDSKSELKDKVELEVFKKGG